MNEVYGQSVARQQQPEQMQQNGEASGADIVVQWFYAGLKLAHFLNRMTS